MSKCKSGDDIIDNSAIFCHWLEYFCKIIIQVSDKNGIVINYVDNCLFYLYTWCKYNVQFSFSSLLQDTNVLGFKGPRRMTVILPGMGLDQQRIPMRPLTVCVDLLSCICNSVRFYFYCWKGINGVVGMGTFKSPETWNWQESKITIHLKYVFISWLFLFNAFFASGWWWFIGKTQEQENGESFGTS